MKRLGQTDAINTDIRIHLEESDTYTVGNNRISKGLNFDDVFSAFSEQNQFQEYEILKYVPQTSQEEHNNVTAVRPLLKEKEKQNN